MHLAIIYCLDLATSPPIAEVKSTIKRLEKKPEKKAFKKGMSVKQALLAYDQKPNMSRRRPTNVLVAFPVFDKCDSLLYFPTTMVKYFNSVDMESAVRLIYKYIDKNCAISFNSNVYESLSPRIYTEMMFTAAELEPDRIMCVHSTKVVENRIKSTIYIKVTDLQPLHSFLQTNYAVFNEADSAKLGLHPDRCKRFQLYATGPSTSEQALRDLQSHAMQDENIEMYMRLDYCMTIDEYRKKIVKIDHVYSLTSVRVAGSAPSLL